MSQKLADQVALVTGASKGIGAAIARALAAEGAAVVVNYSSSREGAEKVVQDITSAGGRAIAVQGNVSRPDDITRLLAETHGAFGRLDILVNNAGIYEAQPIGTITADSFHRQFDLNVLGLILTSQEALKYFPAEGGSIIHISSIVSTWCPPGTMVYNATKGAVDAVTRTMSRELAPRKVRVNAVNPGLIATEGTHAIGFVSEGATESPFGPIGRVEDIAAVVTFLASSDSRWINGETHNATGVII